MQRRANPAAIRAAERRAREEAAPRLLAEIPQLVSLDIRFQEESSFAAPVISHTKRVVIPTAPALFEIGCGDSSCEGGGHDLTLTMMRELHQQNTEFTGEDACNGTIKNGACQRVLKFKATARYENAEAS